MKICIVSDLYYPYPGGVAEHVHHTFCELKKLGHDVKILTTNYGLPSDEKDIIRIGKAVPFPINKSLGIIPFDIRLPYKTKEILNKYNFDIIHMHGPNPFLPLCVLRYSKAVNILTFHASGPELWGHNYLKKRLAPYLSKLDGAIAVSAVARECMERHFKAPNTIIPNGIDTKRFSPKVQPFARFKDGRPNILFVGRFEPRKGLQYIIQAMSRIRQIIPNARLIVVGRGLLKDYTKRQLENIVFEGSVSREAVPRYYASCEVYVSPATGRESFGIVLLEAMATGKPVVASNIPGYRQVIKDGYNGLLVEPKNPDALADAVVKILKTKDLRTKLIENGLRTAQKYSWPKVTRDIENYYYETAARKRGTTEGTEKRTIEDTEREKTEDTEKKSNMFYVGIDIGSISVNVAVLNENKEVLQDWYVRTEGAPLQKVYEILKEIYNKYLQKDITAMAVTGAGGKLLSEILNIPFVNEILAQTTATGCLYPGVRSIIEIGGEDSKLILTEYDKTLNTHVIKDFAMNTICAAGTGSFLDQQAARLELTIEEFGNLALKSQRPPRIAGRCSVFANTDMIHLQQEATPDYDIVAGLCFALARNFKSVIAKGKGFIKPVSFQGGVAANKGMQQAFKEVLNLQDDEFIIPKHFASVGAIGCALIQIENQTHLPCSDKRSGTEPARQESKIKNPIEIERIPEFLSHRKEESNRLEPLILSPNHQLPVTDSRLQITNHKIPVYLGIDVGSISTNVVAIDEQKQLVARRYLWTSGRPIDAVRQGIEEISKEIGNQVEVKGVGTTGSGRYMIGDLVGADIVKNEITSQARAAIEIDPNVDTIFEIGGQDSKFISLSNGVITDFEMNKVCAAGTGSFLEEQAERLNLNIKEEFGGHALQSKAPVGLGERCTVFMQSDLTAHQQQGAARDDLAAGLSYSIAYNYLNRVVEKKKIGNNIFFQGAVAHNKGVVAAFEKVLGKPVTVPPHNDVTGAIGVAIITLEHMNKNGGQKSQFKGFELSQKEYQIESFGCDDCPNQCEIKKVIVAGEEPLYYGSRCDKYEKKSKVKEQKVTLDLFAEREELLLKAHKSQNVEIKGQKITCLAGSVPLRLSERGRQVGIPRALIFHEYLPFWTTFFQELGFNVVVSETTSQKTIHKGVESVTSEHCFPVKVCHGHVSELVEKGVDYIFIPSLISMQKEDHPRLPKSQYNRDGGQGIQESYSCPFVQATPYVVEAALDIMAKGIKLLKPVLYLKRGKKHVEEVLTKLGKELNKSKNQIIKAIKQAEAAQNEFYKAIKARGKEILDNLSEHTLVIIGRPYNTCDKGLNLNIPKILANMGMLAIPMDFLPVEDVDIGKDWPNMYWRYGQRILSALRIIKQHPKLYPLYITNFGCGADSFLVSYFSKEMGKKPYLVIEVDEHSAPTGIITRCEAFLDSIENVPEIVEPVVPLFKTSQSDYQGKTLYIPFMGYQSYVVAAAFKHCEIDAQVIPPADEESLELGRKYTTDKECFPCILTTGDMVKLLQQPDFDRNKAALLMPESCGPCRFGQYNRLQRMVLSDLGYDDLPVVSPNQALNFYQTLREYGFDFAKRAWIGVCTVDTMDKMAQQVRPYEINKGETDKVYFQALDRICESVEGTGNIFHLIKGLKEEFEAIPVKKVPKPIIGIAGEIYIRSHHFANNNIIRTVEELGGEVWTSTMTEWFFYVNFRRKEDNIAYKQYIKLLKHWLMDSWQHKAEHKVQREVEDFVTNLAEPRTEMLFGYSNPYLHQTVEGEAVLTVGKCIDFIEKGASGVITVMPFTCMPGTNVAAVMEKVKEEYNIPYLNMAYDGLEQATANTRLEAFMHQAKQYMLKNKRLEDREQNNDNNYMYS